MDLQLIDMPQVCLEEIFKKLSFAEISQLGATCKYFREISKTIFRLYFKNIEDIIEREMEKIETEASKPEKLSIPEHMHLALLHSVRLDERLLSAVLRIILSEAKMLNAHCWRYIRDSSYDFCFPAGVILDEFDKIIRCVRNKTLKKDMEPEITTMLFHLGETFYDYFDFKIENLFHQSSDYKVKITSETNRQTFLPNIYNFVSNITRESLLKDIHRHMRRTKSHDVDLSICDQLPASMEKKIVDIKNNNNNDYNNSNKTIENDQGITEKTLFGVKVLDILNCCASSNFHTLLLHNYDNDGFKLKTDYELRDINVLEALPTIGLSISNSEKQLNKICRYIRNNVRWTNLFHPLQDLWMLEDAIEINRDVETASALLRHWKLQRATSNLKLDSTLNDMCQYNYRKIISRFKNRFGLLVSANLECPSLSNVPLKIQKSLEITSDNKIGDSVGTNVKDQQELIQEGPNCGNSIQHINMEKWEGNIATYKFHLELKIQYPSFLSETIREAILKVDQVGGKTTVTTDGDDIRKSATYRVDDENFD